MFCNRHMLFAAGLLLMLGAEVSAAPARKTQVKQPASAPAARDVASAGPMEPEPKVSAEAAPAQESPAAAPEPEPEAIEGKPSSVQIQIRLLADKLA